MIEKTWETRFNAWMAKVDAHISRQLGGLTSEDLPDCCYAAWFQDGMIPSKAAKWALRYAKVRYA